MAKKTRPSKDSKKPSPKAARSKGSGKARTAKPAAKPAKKAAKKTLVKAAAKPAKAKAAPKPSPKPPAKVEKPTGTKAVAPEPAKAPPTAADKKKVAPKGITIVTPKPVKTSKAKPKFVMPVSEPLLKPGAKWKPLIPSGPSAPPRDSGLLTAADNKGPKPKMGKRELDRYKNILLRKRSELVGDIATMEEEALRQSSGSLSHTPQHMAEQGTEVFDQSLSLDLAQVDRNLIREIDAALGRIEEGTYGICELTGKPIKPERLEELPWARYSIEAARERERRPYLS